MLEGIADTLVVFDFDGTLADTWRDIANALNLTLAEIGEPPVEGPQVRYWIGDGALKLLERAVPQVWRKDEKLDEVFAIFRHHYDRCCLDTTETYGGIVECLDALDGAVLAVASNKPTRFLDRIVRGLGLESRFQVVIGGDALDVCKPDPAVLRHIVDRAGGGGYRLWLVGDSAIDIETGRRAGARTIGCAWGLRGSGELREARCDFLVEHPSEIPPIVLHD